MIRIKETLKIYFVPSEMRHGCETQESSQKRTSYYSYLWFDQRNPRLKKQEQKNLCCLSAKRLVSILIVVQKV